MNPVACLVLSVLVFVPACTPADPLPVYVGIWRNSASSYDSVAACNELTIEYGADSTFTIRSGKQLITAHYETWALDSGFVVELSDVKVNDHPNCQGYPADYVRRNQASQFFIRTAGRDTMRVHYRPDTPWLNTAVRVR